MVTTARRVLLALPHSGLLVLHQEGVDVAAHREAELLHVLARVLLGRGVAVGDVEDLHALGIGVFGELDGARESPVETCAAQNWFQVLVLKVWLFFSIHTW